MRCHVRRTGRDALPGTQTHSGGAVTKSLGFTHYDGHAYPILSYFFTLSRVAIALQHRRSHALHFLGLSGTLIVFHLARQKWWDVS